MARMSISLSDDLRARMDALGDPPVNWSQVASRAFEHVLGERAARKRRKSLQDVVQRLRASRIAGDEDTRTRGQDAGEQWASDQATWDQLRRLAEFDTSRLGSEAPPSGRTWSDIVFEVIRGGETDPLDCQSHWAGYEDPIPPAEFVRGFCEGASVIFDAVAEQVEER